ncbi:hypothetical protein K4G90_21245, partial [Mycobacterium tuberculosis]|nr:hypothetical protein [Mycobacterium tuberculosis]
EDNVQEAASGVKGENSVKIYGNDLAQLTKTANAVKAALEGDDDDAVKTAFEKLQTSQTKIGEALYAQSQAEGAAGAEAGAAGAEGAQASDDDIVDAEVVDDDNDGKK